MICVSIGRTRHKMMIAEHKAIAERGAQLVELRLDWLSHTPDLSRLLQNRPTPVIVTCRRKADKGNWTGTEEQRLTLLRSAIVAGVEYVDLEEDVAHLIPRYGKTRRIISHHNFDETPQDLEAIHTRLCALQPDIVKLVTTANSPTDNVRMLRIVAGSSVPTAGFCMGELGTISRILTGRYGSPFTYATFSSERTMAPGQLTLDEMQRMYRYDQIDASTEIYGVLGDPIAHSLSPRLHNAAFQQEGLNKVYLPIRVPKDMLLLSLEAFEWFKPQGYSVTLPHKSAVLDRFKRHTGPVNSIGAANTLYHDAEGRWCAANTDCDAALDSLLQGLRSEAGAEQATLAGKKVLILGAGGVARAIGWGLVQSDAVVMIASRSKDRSDELVQHLGCQQILWENRGAVFADILINCTPVGMHPNLDETPFASNWLREGMLVFDTIYTPEQTLLIKQARERDCRTVTGVELFVRQAARQFELFTGRPAPIELMRERLRNAISFAARE